MVARRLHVTGASGSGTTTVGRAVATRLGLAHVDADDLFWLPTVPPYLAKRDRDERLRAALTLVEQHGALVWSGSIVGWGEVLEDAFDAIVYLRTPTDVRLRRLEARELVETGRPADPEFLAWAARYDDGGLDVRSSALHEHWLAERRCPVLRLAGDADLDAEVALVLRFVTDPT
jgi:hypothetical protein